MAEERNPFGSNLRIIIIAAVIFVIVAIIFVVAIRGCSSSGPKDITIYSDLELSDAAKVVTRLKELKIPYKIKDKGTAVVVPRARADEARLGLAEKNLPTGGLVGWEIFNETKMGATDFDRRIQLVRAISGELSRTIKRIKGVQDARVQIVLPETRLFEVAKAPVTASVLLRLGAGARLTGEQIRGITHLVASSVENLKTENVTVVDESGSILSDLSVPPLPRFVKPVQKTETVEPVTTEAVRTFTAEEKALLRLKAKEEYERQLSASSQLMLNKLMPLNVAVAKVSIEFGLPEKTLHNYTRLKIKSESGLVTANIRRMTVIVLIDEKFSLTEELKKNIYQTLALSVPYNRERGDRIVLKTVPFRNVTATVEDIKKQITQKLPPIETKEDEEPDQLRWWIIGGAVLIGLIIFISRRRIRQAQDEEAALVSERPSQESAGDAVEQIKNMADKNPERIADLLKRWLTEEGEEGA
ncbi:flagellar basal-body MS-ring/collar protein FliF [Candidatus Margulisiibacteriota bacterium]